MEQRPTTGPEPAGPFARSADTAAAPAPGGSLAAQAAALYDAGGRDSLRLLLGREPSPEETRRWLDAVIAALDLGTVLTPEGCRLVSEDAAERSLGGWIRSLAAQVVAQQEAYRTRRRPRPKASLPPPFPAARQQSVTADVPARNTPSSS